VEPSCQLRSEVLFSRQIEPGNLKNFAAQLKEGAEPQGSSALDFFGPAVAVVPSMVSNPW